MKTQMEKHLINPKESQTYKIVPLIFVPKVTEELVSLYSFAYCHPKHFLIDTDVFSVFPLKQNS